MATNRTKATLIGAPIVLVMAIVTGLNLHEGGRRLLPYWDSLGKVWTVCNGITGTDVTPGKRYTGAECEQLETVYVRTMLNNMGHCVQVPLEFHEIKAWGDFSYNVGTANFCASSAARLLNAGQNRAACELIPRWRFIKGKDCAIKANGCAGIPIRRNWEYQTCIGNDA